ncbi:MULTISPECIES: hypothetical protein [unclassified Kitasatospora]|uniref:hypothetical protein n=1 Tax=unclassified Kitasatospora TaxID=2633591 RepID=UPI00380F4FE5
MAPVPNGVYAIARPGEQLLTLQGPKDNVILLPPTGEPGEQEWQVDGLDNGNVHIRNLRQQSYLGYEGPPRVNTQVQGVPEPKEWALYQSSEPSTFFVVVPGGPVEGVELAVDLSLLKIIPHRIALRPLEVGDQGQAWRFEFHE